MTGCRCFGGKGPGEPTETQLYIDNTEPLYRMKMAQWENLKRKCKKGVFDPEKAKKLFRYLTTEANRRYKREFSGDPLELADRREAETDFVHEFMAETGCR